MKYFRKTLRGAPRISYPPPLYTPFYHLDYLNKDVEGYPEYIDAERAFHDYAERFPEDIDYISDLCELPPLTLDNAGKYSDCADRYLWEFDNISDQHWRVSDYVAYLASTRENQDLKKRIDAFNNYPSEENFLAIINNVFPSSSNNEELLGLGLCASC